MESNRSQLEQRYKARVLGHFVVQATQRGVPLTQLPLEELGLLGARIIDRGGRCARLYHSY